jgi:hypothetical protein
LGKGKKEGRAKRVSDDEMRRGAPRKRGIDPRFPIFIVVVPVWNGDGDGGHLGKERSVWMGNAGWMGSLYLGYYLI